MKQVHAAVRHVQAALTEDEHERFKRAAKRQGMTVQEALREALRRWTFSEGGEPNPFDALVGAFHAGPDLGSGHDDIYDED